MTQTGKAMPWLGAVAVLGSLSAMGQSSGPAIPSQQLTQSMISGPQCLQFPGVAVAWKECEADSHARWLAELSAWRRERRIKVGLDDERYRDARLRWTQSAFIQPQVMVEDRYLYDPRAGHYTVDRLLADLTKRYGGVDAVLVWPTYPNMGIDDRNQVQMLLSMPGGRDGVRGMVEDFHRRGVRVLFPIMPWDSGTQDPGAPWSELLGRLMTDIGADGMNGDTEDGVPLSFVTAAERTGHPLAFQPELPMPDEALSWNVMSWGYYSFESVPKVDRYRWLEPRHMVNVSDRWSRSKTDDLQYAFFNGEGWESWENVWGIWNGITPRDAEAARRVATLERGVADFLTSAEWEPFYPTASRGVFASRWPHADQVVWTLVNRTEYDIDGEQLRVPARAGVRWFDLYHGRELHPDIRADEAILSFPIEAHGYGAVLAVHGQPGSSLQALMTAMQSMSAAPLASLDGSWKPLSQTMVPIAATRTYAQAPPGMIRIPGGEFRFRVMGVEVEGGDRAGVDVQYEWEPTPRRFHDHVMRIQPFFIDRTPVTNRQFKKFVDATGYHPKDDANFLKHWIHGNFPDGWAERPVTWVSLEDARAYARWAGKRLPNEWEWQYAAQGTDARPYPWGNAWQADAVPAITTGRTAAPPALVAAHPSGASPFGVMDMVGTVWQWTNEFEDEHTRAAILRGGSAYLPQGAPWYFPQAYRNDQHGKLLLMAPARDRSGEIGFRCAADARLRRAGEQRDRQ
ncbi:MAG TPA: SUMF1/EgtB/PvdO family nonheme iron enzyme [Steroidobacteraceae bacterium]|nr:SUMF1/EgtB/PvdO family nonheme iron enzyme [Steroidobacteraceae bacterium]